MTDMPKFRVGDIVGSRANPGFEYEVVAVCGPATVDLKVLNGGHAKGYVHRSVGNKPLHLLRPAPPATDAQDGLTILDAESRAALKVGDRVLVEAEIARAADEDGDVILRVLHADGRLFENYAANSSIYAKLPEAKKEIAVGDFVSILRRTGSKGKVLAFMSNGHAVVEYAAGDDFNVGHYDVSCLEVI